MYSSTTLSGPAKSGCWKQLDYAEQHADSLFPLEYRSYLGQAAHAVLQYVAEERADTPEKWKAVAERVGNLLIRDGRTFRGHQEPPLPADDVWQGVEVALAYLEGRGLPWDAELLIPEQEWAHPTLPFTALIDLVDAVEEGDEEYSVRVATVTDYKSSWQADEGELDTLQRWGQAVCLWRNIQNTDANWPPGKGLIEPDIIRQRVVNLRTCGEWTRDIHLDDPDEVAELEKWEKRIEELCETATDKQWAHAHEGFNRPATPGAGCLSCAWRHICPEVQVSENPLALHAAEAAEELAILEGQRKLLLEILKAQDTETPISISGGWVGYQQKETRIFRHGAEKHLLGDWFEAMAAELPPDLAPVLTSLLSAFKLSKGNLDALAKALHPQRTKGIGDIRDEWVKGVSDVKRYSQFGVWGND